MKTIKRVLLAASFLAGSTAIAGAADLGQHRSLKDEPVLVLPATWTGLYIGANGGYSWNKSEWLWTYNNAKVSPDFDGGIFGGHIGYNYQMGNLVLGIEASISGGNGSGDVYCPNDTYRCRTELNSLFLVGPRVGYARDKMLFYATGGYARASLHTETEPPFTGYDRDTTHNGWAIGGGLEYVILPNIVVGAEYVHVDLSSKHIDTGDSIEAHKVDGTMNIVRARLSYKIERREEPLK